MHALSGGFNTAHIFLCAELAPFLLVLHWLPHVDAIPLCTNDDLTVVLQGMSAPDGNPNLAFLGSAPISTNYVAANGAVSCHRSRIPVVTCGKRLTLLR